jgi:hypothetical protein
MGPTDFLTHYSTCFPTFVASTHILVPVRIKTAILGPSLCCSTIVYVHFDLDYVSDSLSLSLSEAVEDNILLHGLVLYSMCMLYMDSDSRGLSVPIDYNCNILSILFLLYLDICQSFICFLD